MYGYGCAALHTQPDGHKRYGRSFLLDPTAFRYVNLTPAQGFDPTEAALCQGDSGGPLVQGGRVIGVNTGNDPDYSFFARLDFEKDGRIYKEGDKIKQDCNECECFDGKWLCTLMGCDDPPKDP